MERRLYRSQRNRILFGVCGGLGEYFNIDPVIIRIIAVLLIVLLWLVPGIIAYIIMALIIPVQGSAATTPQESMRENFADIKNTTANIGEEIRTTFSNAEVKTDTTNPPSSGPSASSSSHSRNRGIYILGLILIVLGVMFLFGTIFSWYWRFFWPVALIAAGLVVILLVTRRPKS